MVGNFGFLFTKAVGWGEATGVTDIAEELKEDTLDDELTVVFPDDMSVTEESSELVDIGDTGGEL